MSGGALFAFWSPVRPENFHTWVPFRIVGLEKAGDKGEKRYRIQGIATTEHMDQDGDTIVQGGLDFTPFLKHGWFNDNHSKDTADVLGYPDRVYSVVLDDDGVKVPATAVEGYLLDTPAARKIVEIARSLEGTPRQLGFSIEGPLPVRDPRNPNRIVKATVRNVAITNCPVNPHTKLGLAKSLRALGLAKGMDVGAPGQARGVAVTGSARPLMPESLGFRLHLTGDPDATDDRLRTITDDWRKANGGRLSKSAATQRIQARFPQATAAEVDRILALARRMENP